MAAVAKSFARVAARSTPLASSTRTTIAHQNTRFLVPRQTIRSSRRGYSSEPGSKSSNANLYWSLGVTAALGVGGYIFFQNGGFAALGKADMGQKSSSAFYKPKLEDYQKVYNAIAKALEEKDEYDDGSYGPVLVRLAWHCSGTFDKETGTGGSNGATMRFAPEGDHGANAGLKTARDFMEPIKAQFPWITYSDLWTLGGVCAVQEMQGPSIPWRPGRTDRDVAMCTPDGRLPDASKEQSHLRAIFGRMGFDDREIVALSGAHALGRCHTDRSGFEGPWTFSPTVMSNDYYIRLLNDKWGVRKWNGPKQFEDAKTKSIMMLPTDMALVKDKLFKKHVDRYAQDEGVFFKEFSDVFVKLLELGVPFQSKGEDRLTLKSTIAA